MTMTDWTNQSRPMANIFDFQFGSVQFGMSTANTPALVLLIPCLGVAPGLFLACSYPAPGLLLVCSCPAFGPAHSSLAAFVIICTF